MKMDSKTYMVIGAGIASVIVGMMLGNTGSHPQNKTVLHPPPPVNRVQVSHPPVPSVKPPALPETGTQNQSTNQSENGNSVKPPQISNEKSKRNNTSSNNKHNIQQHTAVAKKVNTEKTHIYHPVYHPVHHYTHHKIVRKNKHKRHTSANFSYIKEMSVVCKLNQDCRLTDGVKSYKPGDRIGRYYIKRISLLSVELKTKDGKEIRVRLTQ